MYNKTCDASFFQPISCKDVGKLIDKYEKVAPNSYPLNLDLGVFKNNFCRFQILDTPDRLRDTLVHEMCHAAAWLINDVSDGHGPFWKAW